MFNNERLETRHDVPSNSQFVLELFPCCVAVVGTASTTRQFPHIHACYLPISHAPNRLGNVAVVVLSSPSAVMSNEYLHAAPLEEIETIWPPLLQHFASLRATLMMRESTTLYVHIVYDVGSLKL